jgi:hypothetical protein
MDAISGSNRAASGTVASRTSAPPAPAVIRPAWPSGGGQDVDDVVADQDAADQAFLAGMQRVDRTGLPVAVAGQLVHPWPRGAGQRRL